MLERCLELFPLFRSITLCPAVDWDAILIFDKSSSSSSSEEDVRSPIRSPTQSDRASASSTNRQPAQSTASPAFPAGPSRAPQNQVCFLESLAGQFAMLPRRRSGGRRKALLEKVLGYLPPPKTE
ncbi:hypothetical protein DL546_004298 [Coniochaeta pulveracea]|uniref:Uncharacterized protein n=1 Tax=Coniochaeta pulveracea TaxID=177199 RepID=A0A420Y6X6_9PEZI|nr:hypothetical protein DL546_004298 [Coniochaeta pulveracea]